MSSFRYALSGLILLAFLHPAILFAATQCDPDNGGITLPHGFCATVLADNLGQARHVAVSAEGVVYVALEHPENGGGIVALEDRDHDGHADVIKHFGDTGGTGIGVYDGYLYVSSVTAVRRYRLPGKGLVPQDPAQIIVQDMPEQSSHNARSFAISAQGDLYLNSGAPSNSCQKQDRATRSEGMDPCPLLKHHGGIFRFRADKMDQTYGNPGHHFATGIRNAVAIAWNAGEDQLYAVQHGRDQLHQNWPRRFTSKQGATLPAEEFLKVDKGDNFGWPYCYYDAGQGKNVLAPEYGGDGHKIGRCGKFQDPIMAFPAHWAPNGLLFYTGKQFPSRYRHGAFVAFHGSWNRAPLPQEGYKVVFVPFKGALPAGHWQDFAGGFAGKKPLSSPGSADYRPVGLAQGPDGALYISEDQHGRIWRVVYTGG